MGGASATFEFKAFIAAMKQSKPLLNALALQDIRAKAERIVATAKDLAPVGTPEEGDPHPGAMREDIGIKGEGIDNKGAYVDVGTTEPYGLYQEFGTEHNPAQPFMRPAIAQETASGALPTRVFLAPSRDPFKRVRRARRSAK